MEVRKLENSMKQSNATKSEKNKSGHLLVVMLVVWIWTVLELNMNE